MLELPQMIAFVLLRVLLVLFLVAANAFFAAAEFALVTVRDTRIQQLIEARRIGARILLRLHRNLDEVVNGVQLGVTVVSLTLGWIGEPMVAHFVEGLHFLEKVPHAFIYAHGIAIAIAFGLITCLHVILGELVPKSLALRAAERYSLVAARPLVVLSWLAKPLVWVLSASANLLLKPFGDKTTFTESRHSAEELQQLVEEASQAGTVNAEAAEIASRALDLPELVASDVMVPRQEVVAIPLTASDAELRRILLEQTKSRLPVYQDRIDNVVGYISVKDLLALAWERRLIVLQDAIREPFFVPTTMNAVELIKEMRRRHQPFAIVVDEHGGMAGLVTMEDVLEELVGEIFSEHESEGRELVTKRGDGTALVSGLAAVRDVNRTLDVELPDDGPWSTVAGLVLALAGRLPKVGETFEPAPGIQLKVVDVSPRRIRSVELHIQPSKADGEPVLGRQ